MLATEKNLSTGRDADRNYALKPTNWRLTYADGTIDFRTGIHLCDVIRTKIPVKAEFANRLAKTKWTPVGTLEIGRAIGQKRGLAGSTLEKFAVDYYFGRVAA
jgi:hypothetical protein